MTIRNFTKKDRAEFLCLSREFYSSDAVSHSVPEKHFMRTFDEVLAGNPLMRGLILEHEGKIAGFAHLSFTWSNEAGGLVVLLEELYIKPEFRNLKMGTEFLEEMIGEYRGKARRFRLEVTDSNMDARRLYERLGFETIDYTQMILDFPEE